MIPVISFVGNHNSGKTTLLANVVSIMEQRGIRTAVVKDASSGLDLPGHKDSDRLFRAGASMVYAVSPGVSLLYSREDYVNLAAICEKIKGVDLIISEGFKREAFPKIEVLRQEISTTLLPVENVVARVVDFTLQSPLPVFSFDQPQDIADFICTYFSNKLCL